MWHPMNSISALSLALQVPDSPSYTPDTYSNPSGWQQVSSALSTSMHRVLVKLASFLPGLMALIIAVVLLTAIGTLVAFLLRKILTAVKFDERLANSSRSSTVTPNLQDWAPSHSPTLLVARIGFWACVLLGFVIGISAFDASYSGSSQMAFFLIPYLTHAVGAVLILLAGNLIARFLARSILIGAVNAQFQYARFLSLGIKWLVLVLTAAMVLDHLRIGGAIVELAFGILFGGIVLTLSLAVGLGSRDLVGRSLERNVEFAPDPTAVPLHPTADTASETLRHF